MSYPSDTELLLRRILKDVLREHDDERAGGIKVPPGWTGARAEPSVKSANQPTKKQRQKPTTRNLSTPPQIDKIQPIILEMLMPPGKRVDSELVYERCRALGYRDNMVDRGRARLKVQSLICGTRADRRTVLFLDEQSSTKPITSGREITEDLRKQVRALSLTRSAKEISIQLGMSTSLVGQILRGER